MINDKQFLLAKKPYINEGWNNIKLLSGYILSWHYKLPVVFNKNKSIVLLGWAYESKDTEIQPAEQINELSNEKISTQCCIDKERIINMEKTWCGRYIVIAYDSIYLDATGLLNVFYGYGMVSSSLNILREVNGLELRLPTIFHGISPNYIPGTYTEYEDIRRLLPSQILNYLSYSITIRPLLPDGIIYGMADDERIFTFIDRLSISFGNLCKQFKDDEIWFAATGGRDSRTTLSVLEYAGVNYKMFTLQHDNISQGDINVPRMIAEVLRKEYHYFTRKENNYSKQREKEFTIHCAGMAEDSDKLFWAYGQYQELISSSNNNAIILRSGIYESAIPNYISLDRLIIDSKRNKLAARSLAQWIGYVNNDNVNKDIEISNRIYLELRAGCWLSSLEQSLDIMDQIISIQPINCRYLISLLLGFDEIQRKTKSHEELIANTALPILKDIPYEDQINDTRKKKKARWKRIHNSIHVYGVKSTLSWLAHTFYLKLFSS